jgi:hypothetical protein
MILWGTSTTDGSSVVFGTGSAQVTANSVLWGTKK